MIIHETNLEKSNSIDPFESKIICGETLKTLQKIPGNSVSLIVTSPSYFLGKSYEKEQGFNEYLEDHKEILQECKRVLKNDGAIFWNVAQTIMDKEIFPLGSIFYNIFKQLDFHLKNWIIWKFGGGETPKTRLFGRYENVLWFVKDIDNYIFNIDEIRVPSKWITDKRCNENGKNPSDFWEIDERTNMNKITDIKRKLNDFRKQISIETDIYVNQIKMDEKIREIENIIDDLVHSKNNVLNKNLSNNIWYFNRVVNISKKEKIKHPITGETHPCPFPESLIKRIVKMASNKGDVVLDIFSGSGTLLKIAEELGRKWIGIDKELKYCEIAESRIKSLRKQSTLTRFLDVSIDNT